VVYVTSEGVRGFKRRMIAMRQYYKAHPEVPFFVAYVMPNLGTISGDAKALVDLVRAAIPEGVPVAAIIIDTLARAMTGMSDSDTAAMSLFVDNCDAIAKAFDCFIGVVHHSPRADETRSRGSNVLDGAADVIISVVKDGASGISTAKVDRLKDGEEGAAWRFRVNTVEVPDRNGSTCFVPLCETLGIVAQGAGSETRRNRKLSGQQQRFMDILAEAIIDHGRPVVGSIVVPSGLKAVEREQLRKHCFEAGFIDRAKPDAARATFSRMINTLAGKHVIGATEDHIWLPERDRAKQPKHGEASELVSANTNIETPKHPPIE
jgi:hypothetical protein